jgi:hypothetical protein
MHVDRLAENLFDGTDHARMRAKQSECFVIEVGCKRSARRTALLAPYFRALMGIDALRLAPEQRYFVFIEELGEEQPSLFVEVARSVAVSGP